MRKFLEKSVAAFGWGKCGACVYLHVCVDDASAYK